MPRLLSSQVETEEVVMKYDSPSRTWVVAISLLLITSSVCRAQNPKRLKSGQQETKNTVPVLSSAQQHGLENLDRIALEARQIDNPAIRTELQTLIADALWDFDKSNARAIFIDALRTPGPTETNDKLRTVK